jgi:hypothetical protein
LFPLVFYKAWIGALIKLLPEAIGIGTPWTKRAKKTRGQTNGNELYRRFERISSAMRKVMGLEAKAD